MFVAYYLGDFIDLYTSSHALEANLTTFKILDSEFGHFNQLYERNQSLESDCDI